MVEFIMRDSLDPLRIKGGFEKIVSDINLQMNQSRKLVVLQMPDDTPIAINVENINAIKAESLEDAFFARPEE